MGNLKQTVIEINGKRYDARTGQLLSQPVVRPATTPKSQPKHHDVARATHASGHMHKTAQRSQTLMRTAVKKPATTTAVKKSQPVADVRQQTPAQAARTSPLTTQNDTVRAARAQQIERSKLVRKFTDSGHVSAATPVSQRVAVLPVQPAPAAAALVAHKPLSLSSSIIERGLRNANSHNETYNHKPAKSRHKKRTRLATYATGTLAALLLVGFIAYQNIPNIAVRYAATRSGITAGVPGYQPAGFALNHHIQYTPGQITLNYSSNSDDRDFTITQRESNWNSDTLRSNYVASKSEQVQTYEDKGRTIYLYGDSNATWVSSGIWYDINGDSELNSDQLIRIATSM